MNTLLVSIPEEFYYVMFILILVGEFDYWGNPECKRLINKFDYIRIFLPTISVALLSNILRYNGLNGGLYQLIPPLVLYILIILTNDIFGDASCVKWMAKAFIFLMLGFISICLTEFIYLPFVLYSTGLDMTKINNDFRLYFGLSLPARVLQYSLLIYFVCRKRTILKGKIFKCVFSNTKLLFIISLFAVFNISFLILMVKAVIYDKALVSIPFTTRFIIIISIILFPITNILGFLMSSYHIKNMEEEAKKCATDKLERLYKDLENYTESGDYDNIMWKLNELGMGIKEISNSLSSGNSTVSNE